MKRIRKNTIHEMPSTVVKMQKTCAKWVIQKLILCGFSLGFVIWCLASLISQLRVGSPNTFSRKMTINLSWTKFCYDRNTKQSHQFELSSCFLMHDRCSNFAKGIWNIFEQLLSTACRHFNSMKCKAISVHMIKINETYFS